MIIGGLLVDVVPFADLFKEHFRGERHDQLHGWLLADGLTVYAERESWRQPQGGGPGAPSRVIRFGVLAKVPGALMGDPAGWLSLLQIDPLHRTAAIGGRFTNSAHWDRGVGPEALLLVTDYAFRWLGLRRLWLIVASSNSGVRRQISRCGFGHEATARSGWYTAGAYQDANVYGLLRADWRGYAVMVAQLDLLTVARKRRLVE